MVELVYTEDLKFSVQKTYGFKSHLAHHGLTLFIKCDIIRIILP